MGATDYNYKIQNAGEIMDYETYKKEMVHGDCLMTTMDMQSIKTLTNGEGNWNVGAPKWYTDRKQLSMKLRDGGDTKELDILWSHSNAN